jgi:hypothetical protein
MRNTRKLKKSKGGSNNNNNTRSINSNIESITSEFLYTNFEVLERLSVGDIDYFRQPSYLRSVNHKFEIEYPVYFYEEHGPIEDAEYEIVVYKGTYLSFLAALEYLLETPKLQPGLSDEAKFNMLKLFLDHGANPDSKIVKYGARTIDERPLKAHAISLYCQEDNERLVNLLLKYRAKYKKWTSEDTDLHLEELEDLLSDYSPRSEGSDMNLYTKWERIFKREELRSKLSNLLKNKSKTNKLRRGKMNVLNELSLLPPVPDLGFPGGTKYRDASESWKAQMNPPSV